MEFSLRELDSLDIYFDWGTITHEEIDSLWDNDDMIIVSNITKLDTIESGDHVYDFIYEGYLQELSTWITFKLHSSYEL